MRASWLMAAPMVAAWATMVRWRSMGRCWSCALSRQPQICSRRSRACSSESRWGMSVSSFVQSVFDNSSNALPSYTISKIKQYLQ